MMPQAPLPVLTSNHVYHPNASKTYLVVKQEHMTNALELFVDTDVHITIQGKRHLGAAIGSRTRPWRIMLKNFIMLCSNALKCFDYASKNCYYAHGMLAL